MTESRTQNVKLAFAGMPPPCEVSGCEGLGTRLFTTRYGVGLANLCLAHIRIALAWRRKNDDEFDLLMRQAHDDLLTFLETGEFPEPAASFAGGG